LIGHLRKKSQIILEGKKLTNWAIISRYITRCNWNRDSFSKQNNLQFHCGYVEKWVIGLR